MTITFSIFDHDAKIGFDGLMIGSDDLIGTCEVDMKRAMPNRKEEKVLPLTLAEGVNDPHFMDPTLTVEIEYMPLKQ